MTLFRKMALSFRYGSDGILSSDERGQITRSIENTFARVFQDMRDQAPSLSPSDLIYCVLVSLGLETDAIADCLSISKNSLRMRKTRVREKLSDAWNAFLFATNCDGNVAPENEAGSGAPITLSENKTKEKVMETNVSFGNAIEHAFKNTFNYCGRASRKEFWYFIVVAVIYFLCVNTITTVIWANGMNTVPGSVQDIQSSFNNMAGGVCKLMIFRFVFQLPTILPALSLTARRLHDTDHSARFLWLLLIPAILYLIEIIGFQSMNTIMCDSFNEFNSEYFSRAKSISLLSKIAPVIRNIVILIAAVLCAFKGTDGENRYDCHS